VNNRSRNAIKANALYSQDVIVLAVFLISIYGFCRLGALLSARFAIVALLRYRFHRSFAYRSSASLHPAQRALGFVMSQVKRYAQSGSGTEA